MGHWWVLMPHSMSSICIEVWRHGKAQAAQKPSTAAHNFTRQLCQKYYEKKVNGLHISNPHNWQSAVRQIMGHKQRSTEPLVGLAQRLHNGNVDTLADHINKFFHQVAADLHPLSDSAMPPPLECEFVIECSAVERKLSQINVYKAPGSCMTCMTSALSFQVRCVPSSTHQSEKVLCLLNGKRSMWFRYPKLIHFCWST